jgi:hypothetical protein
MDRLRTVGAVLMLTAAACGSPSAPGTILSNSGGGSSAVNVTGVWSGAATDSLRQVNMTWQLTQSGSSVSGTVAATTSVGAPIYEGGTVVGTVRDTTLTFTVTIPRGGVANLPDCTVALAGSAPDITATGMTGTYNGNDSCAGAIAGGRFTFVKQ